MALSSYKVTPAIAVSDMRKAKEFYEGKLGFSGGEEQGDGGITYPAGEGTAIHPYPSPDNAGKSGATLAFFDVDDVEKVVDELSSNGVTFEQYDMDPIKTNEKGIAEFDGLKVAWFKDPDGNILAVGDQLDEAGEDLFVHQSVVAADRPLKEGARVSFDAEQGDKGPKAVNVREL